jgi:photosystem II stability/assembly factor-like uncharacterized protein
MKKIVLVSLLFVLCIQLAVIYTPAPETQVAKPEPKIHYEEGDFDGPAEFAKFHWQIRTAEGQDKPAYTNGYKLKELRKSKQLARMRKSAKTKSNGITEWIERGPANVPGRTRGLIVDPADPAKNTWYAGSVGGGVWKTTNAGQTWRNLTPDLPNLATSVLVQATSNPNVIYCGTGEGFFNLDAVDGAGVFKSTDRGESWTQLASTINFPDVNRMAVDPANENIVLAATADGLYRSVNGGTSWNLVLEQELIQDLKATPGNFNILYAAQNSEGVWKSTDAGLTWNETANLGTVGRIEIAISPVNTNRIFVSAEAESFGSGSYLYMSDDGGNSWNMVNVSIGGNQVDFLNEQGWYDNTIACDPFNANIVYFGGVDLFRTQLTSGSTSFPVFSLEASNISSYVDLVNFSSASNGNFDVGPSFAGLSVEFRFGPGQTQKAHRFTVPAGATSGVANSSYTYAGYVDVPFTVWDITTVPNRQLMVSFRDQANNGIFDLLPANTSSTNANEQSREYVFVNNVTYSSSANASIATTGGHVFSEMYNIWPILPTGGQFPAMQNATLSIITSTLSVLNANTLNITDGRGEFGNGKNNNVHVDHHNIVMIPMSATTYKILNANDGGVFVSNTDPTPGIDNNEWTSTDNGYNSSQFYGADKKPGADEYFGGMQDNGTWVSQPDQTANASANYNFRIGGDGFEVIWNYNNPQLLIGGSQFNGFARSTNGGLTFGDATAGLTGNMPFISKLANSNSFPDRIFTLGQNGVFVSTNFGQSWTLTPITTRWANASLMDIDVSRANANIVWAGTGMTSQLSLHVSTNGGQSFQVTNNYTETSMGGITKLATHPTEPNTAYAIFSLAGKPKILRTKNLGQSWQDISGFGTNNVSSKGFPDVAVYCLYVRPDDTNIIWAGTEIGIVESTDGGETWAIIEDFPNVSVWDLKGVDNKIVIGTHGRGIWTATVNSDKNQANVPELPVITAGGTDPSERLAVKVSNPFSYDSIEVMVNNTKIGVLKNTIVGETIVAISGLSFGTKEVRLLAYELGAVFSGKPFSVSYINLKDAKTSHVDYINTLENFIVSALALSRFEEQETERRTLHTLHPYAANTRASAFLTVPIIVQATNAKLYYRDVAILEPNNDFVMLEATSDGVNWLPLKPKYDASHKTNWLTIYNSPAPNNIPAYTETVAHEVNLLDFFEANEKILVRFRVEANATVQAWGWALDYLIIQATPTSVETKQAEIEQFDVYPNPVKRGEEITVSYTLYAQQEGNLRLQDAQGREVASRALGKATQGSESIQTNALQPGMYYVTLQSKGESKIKKVIVQ